MEKSLEKSVQMIELANCPEILKEDWMVAKHIWNKYSSQKRKAKQCVDIIELANYPEIIKEDFLTSKIKYVLKKNKIVSEKKNSIFCSEDWPCLIAQKCLKEKQVLVVDFKIQAYFK